MAGSVDWSSVTVGNWLAVPVGESADVEGSVVANTSSAAAGKDVDVEEMSSAVSLVASEVA